MTPQEKYEQKCLESGLPTYRFKRWGSLSDEVKASYGAEVESADLSDLKKAELVKLAKGMEGFTKSMTKAEIIELIVAQKGG